MLHNTKSFNFQYEVLLNIIGQIINQTYERSMSNLN